MGHWINSRYESKCSECECDILPGDRIYYEPNDKGRAEVFCRPCGEDADDTADDDDGDGIQVDV